MMKRKLFTEAQIVSVLREYEAEMKAGDLARNQGIAAAPIYNGKDKFGRMDVSNAKRLRALEEENGKLKRLLADAMLDASAHRGLLSKNGEACCWAQAVAHLKVIGPH